MKSSSLPRIGYVPNSKRLLAPGDRRRFVAYAIERNLPVEFARPEERYDIVVVSEAADISVWPDYPHGKVVYDLIDSYLSVPRTDIKQFLRGTAWYVLGRHKKFRPDYLTSIRDMCRRSDAVVCATPEQKEIIEQYCGNVHIILDVHAMVVKKTKETYEAGEPFRIVWEGLPSNLFQLAEIAPILRSLAGSLRIELHVITDARWLRLGGQWGTVDTRTFLTQQFGKAVFHDWREETCADIITACDLALIPIDLDDPFVRGKPENKLLLLWRMGMPVVASATPAYCRAMQNAGMPHLTCRNESEWEAALRLMMSSEAARRDAGTQGYAYAEKYQAAGAMLDRWDQLFKSIGFSFA